MYLVVQKDISRRVCKIFKTSDLLGDFLVELKSIFYRLQYSNIYCILTCNRRLAFLARNIEESNLNAYLSYNGDFVIKFYCRCLSSSEQYLESDAVTFDFTKDYSVDMIIPVRNGPLFKSASVKSLNSFRLDIDCMYSLEEETEIRFKRLLKLQNRW